LHAQNGPTGPFILERRFYSHNLQSVFSSKRTPCKGAFSLIIKIQSGLLLFEHILAHTAQGTNPVFRYIFEGCPRSDPTIGVPYLRIIDITASGAYIFIHLHHLPAYILLIIILPILTGMITVNLHRAKPPFFLNLPRSENP
jgi:hypothetical protein